MADGNDATIRRVAEQVAEAAYERWNLLHPRPEPRMDVPPVFKWLGGIAAALLTVASTGSVAWAVSTLNALQITVARMDERQQRDPVPGRLEKIEDRLARLEQPKLEQRP